MSGSWRDGVRAAREEYENDPVDNNLGLALMLFAYDPPDNRFQRGYLAGVRRLYRKRCPKLEALIAPYLTYTVA